jgi:hypothetical protein
MLIRAPTEIAASLYDGPLDPVEDDARRGRGELVGVDALRVTIGQPVGWSVSDAYRRDGRPLPGDFASLLGSDDAVVLAFACTFRIPPGAAVEFAEFTVALSAGSGAAPIAFDLFPLQVTHEVRHNVRVALAPSLRFTELVEITPGEVAVELGYDEIVPSVEALGVREAEFGWRLSRSKAQPLAATNAFYAVVRLGHGIAAISGTCELQADVRQGRLLLPAVRLPRSAQRAFAVTRDGLA